MAKANAEEEKLSSERTNFPYLTPVFIAPSDLGDVTLVQQIETVNAALSCLWETHRWISGIASGEIKKNLAQNTQLASDIIETIFGYHEARQAADEELLIEYFHKLQSISPTMTYRFRQADTVLVANQEELQVIWTNIKARTHDMRRSMHNITSAITDVPLQRLRKSKTLQEDLRTIAGLLASLPDAICKIYETTIYDSKHIMNIFYRNIDNERLHKQAIISKNGDVWHTAESAVAWNIDWCFALAGVISENIDRAFSRFSGRPKHVNISAEEHFDDYGLPVVDIIIDDTGPGWPEEILKHGFSPGFTHWPDASIQGTGTGMAYHAQVLREHYGGDLIPEPFRDPPDGDSMPGARLRIRLPNQTALQEAEAHYRRDPRSHIIGFLQFATALYHSDEKQKDFADGLITILSLRSYISGDYAMEILSEVLRDMHEDDWRKPHLLHVINQLQDS